MRNVAETNDSYLSAISSTLEEWNSDEDNDAWFDLQTISSCGCPISIF